MEVAVGRVVTRACFGASEVAAREKAELLGGGPDGAVSVSARFRGARLPSFTSLPKLS